MVETQGKAVELVRYAQAALRDGGDTRRLKTELSRDNPYAIRAIRKRGLIYKDGMIVKDRRK